MKTEYEIERTKDAIRALDAEQKAIAKKVLLEESGVEPGKLHEVVCDDCCHWPRVCGSQESLDRHCAECEMRNLWQAMFGSVGA